MSDRIFVPARGDIIWLSFDPQVGREQSGRRPALVISPQKYNERTSLALVCPVTSQRKNFPFEVPLPDGLDISGVVLADHVKSLDWRQRRAVLVCSAPAEIVAEILGKFSLLTTI